MVGAEEGRRSLAGHDSSIDDSMVHTCTDGAMVGVEEGRSRSYVASGHFRTMIPSRRTTML